MRDKIAKFEKKGGVPLPRGSLGLGASPITDLNIQPVGEKHGKRLSSSEYGGGHGRSFSLSYTNSNIERKRFSSVSGIAISPEQVPLQLSIAASSPSVEAESKPEGVLKKCSEDSLLDICSGHVVDSISPGELASCPVNVDQSFTPDISDSPISDEGPTIMDSVVKNLNLQNDCVKRMDQPMSEKENLEIMKASQIASSIAS